MSIQHQVNVTIALDQIPQDAEGKGFKSTQALLDWISACLNVNTNHVKAKVTESVPPTVVVEMDGGLIQQVSCDQPVRVITLDKDLEGADEEWIEEIDGAEVYWRAEDVQIEPDRVSRIASEIDSL